MEEEDISERRLKLASLMNRVRSLKTKYQNEENLSDEVNYNGFPADTTDHSASIAHLMMMGNDPADWWSFLVKAEKKGDPQIDHNLLVKLTDVYSRAVSVLPAEEHSLNESYAKILVRFAELKSFSSQDEARDQFQIARLNCKMFAFVHIAFAQFELLQGNFKKSKQILQKAVECRAFPMESLNSAMQNLYLKRIPLLSDSKEDKENFAVKPLYSSQETNLPHAIENSRAEKQSDSSEDISANVNSSNGSSPEDFEVEQKFFQQFPNKMRLYGRVPLETVHSGQTLNIKNNDVVNVNMSQSSGTTCRSTSETSSTMQKPDGDDDSYNLGNVKFGKVTFNMESKFSVHNNLEAANDSTLTLLSKTESSTTMKKREPEKMDQEPNICESYHEQYRLQAPSSLAGPINNNLCQGQAKQNHDEIAWKVPESVCHRSALEGKRDGFEASCVKRSTPPESALHLNCSVQKRTTPPETSSNRNGPAFICGTPGNGTQNDYMSCFRTPVVNGYIPSISQNCTPYSRSSSYQQSKLQTPAPLFQNHGNFQVSTPQTTNECTVIKGRLYTILRQIGTGGSSKVFQVLDEKKHLFAVKYVNLEEADQLTIESYKNEIDYLIKLQSHSDKIIRLYDYEISDHQIRVVMECGNIDLNSWLRKKKTISPWERKSYWKNMLEAVHAIHQHGIVHSDLKPANFLIVDGMLKLIDFGIANQMQPDMTSIVKDSQVGTVNYMPPEAIKGFSSQEENGKTRTKISPKSDVWSLGCILYYMTYGKTPFQHITNQITKLHAIIDANYEIEFPPIPEMDLKDVLKKCLVRNPKWRISIAELLVHPYVQIQPLSDQKMNRGTSEEVKRILGQLICLNSPNSISRAARTLYEQCDSGQSLDVAALTNSVQKPWTMK